MNNFFSLTLDFISQFTGGRGGIDNVVNHAIGAILFSLLFALAIFQRYHGAKDRESLLAWGFGIAFGRELLMVIMSYVQALGLVNPEYLHVVFPPLEHALSTIAIITIAAAFIRYLLNARAKSKIYLILGIGSVIFCYLITFVWWAHYILANPSSKFGQTWCDWLFRINASFFILIAIVWIVKKTKGWLRNTVTLAFSLFFLNEFLKIIDMAFGEVYENIFAPIRHAIYIIAIPLFGYIYIREMYDLHFKVNEEKKRLEEKLNQSHKMQAIGTLAGGIAHDFNNILGIIIGNINLAMMPDGDEYSKRKNLDSVLKASHRAKKLIKQILSFSRKNGKIESLPIQPHLIINEGTKLLRSTLPSTIEIKSDIDNKCGAILIDSTQIHQILMNLATNAVHAMRGKGVLSIKLEKTELSKGEIKKFPQMSAGSYIHLMVSDNGIGMDHDLIARIFEPFFTTKDIHEGTGLGLAVVHNIVTNNNGVITVESERGKGSTFHIYFGEINMKDHLKASLEKKQIMPGTEHILYVDDEESMIEMGTRILEQNGYQVTATTDSQKALEIFKKNPSDFDLLFTDQTMPNMTGTQLIREILKVKEGFPFILCTGFAGRVTEEEVKALGVEHFYLKPMDYNQICHAVRKAIDNHHK